MPPPRRPPSADDYGPDSLPSPKKEADVIADLVMRGVLTVTSARELIDVPRLVRLRLHAFAASAGLDGRRFVEKSLTLRADTLREFNLLVRDRGLEAAPVVH